MLRSTLCLALTLSLGSSCLAQKLIAEPTNINPDLPNVLLIGDSISIGYTMPVRKKMANNSASDNASGPCLSNFSRGRYSIGQSNIFID